MNVEGGSVICENAGPPFAAGKVQVRLQLFSQSKESGIVKIAASIEKSEVILYLQIQNGLRKVGHTGPACGNMKI